MRIKIESFLLDVFFRIRKKVHSCLNVSIHKYIKWNLLVQEILKKKQAIDTIDLGKNGIIAQGS